MPKWKVTLATTTKNRKRPHFQRGHSMTLAAASVISKIEYYTCYIMLHVNILGSKINNKIVLTTYFEY